MSYLALTQFRVAELQPPHLKAMNIDEGWTATYREVVCLQQDTGIIVGLSWRDPG